MQSYLRETPVRQPFEICFFDEEETESVKTQAAKINRYTDDEDYEDCGSQTDNIIALARKVHGIHDHTGKSKQGSPLMLVPGEVYRFFQAFCLYRLESGLYLFFLAAFLIGTTTVTTREMISITPPEGTSDEMDGSWGMLEILAVALIFMQTTYLVVREAVKQLRNAGKP